MEISDYISIIGALLTFWGLMYTAKQLKENRELSRLNILNEHWRDFWNDEKLTSIYYKIEYGEFEYSNSFHGSEDEKEVDRLLGVFQNIALYKKRNALSWEDVDLIGYHITRILLNSEIQKYFSFLNSWAEDNGLKSHSFSDAENLASEYFKISNRRG